MWKYTNGIGHLVMSVFMTLVGLVLLIYPGLDSGAHGVGIGLIVAVQAAWFVSGGARQVAHEVANQLQQSQPAPAPAPVEANQNSVPTVPRLPIVQPPHSG